MLSVHIIAVGKLKERYLTEACQEYQKRLQAFCKLHLVEVEEYRLPSDPSQAQIDAGMAEEGRRILQKVPTGSHLIALCVEGRLLSSEELAGEVAQVALQGVGAVTFVIGGSHGLAPEVKAAAKLRLSMSRMTFPHQLARVLLLEQVSRAMTINENRTYHK